MKTQLAVLLAVLVFSALLGPRLIAHKTAISATDARQGVATSTSQPMKAVPSENPFQRKPVRFSTRNKEGYSIHGIQPGDDLQQLIDELPHAAKAEKITETHPRPGLRFTAPGQQSLAVTSKLVGKRKVVSEIWCMGPAPNFSIERDGKTVLNGTSSYQDFTDLLGRDVHGRGAVMPDGLCLRVEFTSNGLFVASLSMVD